APERQAGLQEQELVEDEAAVVRRLEAVERVEVGLGCGVQAVDRAIDISHFLGSDRRSFLGSAPECQGLRFAAASLTWRVAALRASLRRVAASPAFLRRASSWRAASWRDSLLRFARYHARSDFLPRRGEVDEPQRLLAPRKRVAPADRGGEELDFVRRR